MSSNAELTEQLLYVNSFVKKNGTDYSFTVDLPQQSISQLSLISAGIDVWTPNLYDTFGKRFSEFGLGVAGVIYRCDVFIASLAEFCTWFNAQSPRYKITLQAVPSYSKVFSFKVTDGAAGPNTTSTLIGDGWQKLGITDYTTKVTHTGTRIFDLSLPPQILVRITNPAIKNNIQSNIGQAHFAIPNTASFGGKLIYQNDISTPNRNTIYLPSQTNLSVLQVDLLNCDFAPLYSCDFGFGRDNNDAEVVLVFATRK